MLPHAARDANAEATMTADPQTFPTDTDDDAAAQPLSPGDEARRLIRQADTVALGTLDGSSGGPFVSLATMSTDPAGAPLFMLSSLAWHTRNLAADPRVSVLVDATTRDGDALEGARLTLIGRMQAAEDEGLRRRFLARHPLSARYAGFGDFAIYRVAPELGHLVAGFGRIQTIGAEKIMLAPERAREIAEAEEGIVAHMNEDHADAVALYATRLLGAPPGDWRMTACDPDGCDLSDGHMVVRLELPETVATPQEMRVALVDLVKRARAMPETAENSGNGGA